MRKTFVSLATLGVALGLSGCAASLASLPPAAAVTARGETEPVGTANQDAADDPAIWRNAEAPEKSLIVGTDKKAGLYVYGLDGAIRSYSPAGQLNNVALAETDRGIIVAASDRADPLRSRVALFVLDPQTGELSEIGRIASGPGEAYGLCMAPAANPTGGTSSDLRIFAAIKDGTVREISLELASAAPKGTILREWKISTQIEGCVVDTLNNDLFVGEEAVGVWRIDLDAPSPVPEAFARVDGIQLVADVEGLAIASPSGGPRYLVASSQGDNAFALFDLESAAFVGRFRIVEGAVDGTSETDGIEIVSGDCGDAFPGRLMVAQDGDNGGGTQNFKFVAWADIARILGLP